MHSTHYISVDSAQMHIKACSSAEGMAKFGQRAISKQGIIRRDRCNLCTGVSLQTGIIIPPPLLPFLPATRQLVTYQLKVRFDGPSREVADMASVRAFEADSRVAVIAVQYRRNG